MNDELLIRPARPEDRPAMEHICEHTWDHGDYIPQVWDEWLADEQGALIVGELGAPGGPVVALSKITFQRDAQVWLEGMRVDPEYRERGIASRFLEYALRYARSHGAHAVRLATGDYNTAVHHMAEHHGMEHVGNYAVWGADPLPGGPEPSFLGPKDRPQVEAFLGSSEVLSYSHGLYALSWAAEALSAARITELLDAGQITAARSADGQIAALIIVSTREERDELWIGFADGEHEALTRLARAVRAYAAQVDAERVRVMIPHLDWPCEVFRAAGFGPGEWEGELRIYQTRWRQPPAEDPPAGLGRA
jgi:GNAT superfamily N-acetyltransferase